LPALSSDAIAALLEPYLGASGLGASDLGAGTDPEAGFAGSLDRARLYDQLAIYLELILKWNARINLTAIRAPEEIVRRHFGESLFVGARLGACETLLDFGSGAGLPGVPIQLTRPDVVVTLAESRSRKAAFLSEAVRVLGLRSEVWGRRVEEMPAGRQFDVVAMRAVDDMEAAVLEAGRRAKDRVMVLGGEGSWAGAGLEGFRVEEAVELPRSERSVLWVALRE
jgi:16S rRNA (guanine527-N7)-methyltransferase